MIKGNGMLRISDATIRVAVQEYLDKRLTAEMSVNVDSIKMAPTVEGDNLQPSALMFDIAISEKSVA